MKSEHVIDAQGFRANVGIVLVNQNEQVFWGKRIRQEAWQFAQGGLAPGETPEEALYRELQEEMGLQPDQVQILGVTHKWLRYTLPQRYIRHGSVPVCIGQKQKWYLLKLNAPDAAIGFQHCPSPEFDDWRWVSYWYPLRDVISFKREVYRKALVELSRFIVSGVHLSTCS